MVTHPLSSGTSLPDRLPALLAGSITYRSIIFFSHFYNFFIFRAPTDCVQYFSDGISGNVKNYNFGIQIISSQDYGKECPRVLFPNWYCLVNCVRQEVGYCRIQWQANSATTPDTFQLDTDGTTNANAAGSAIACVGSFVTIPNASLNGITALSPTMAFQDSWCGGVLGVDGTAVSVSVVCK